MNHRGKRSILCLLLVAMVSHVVIADWSIAAKGVDVAASGARSVAPTTTALRRVGDLMESAHDVLANPNLLKGKGLAQVRSAIGQTHGWANDVMRHSTRHPQGGWVFREMNKAGTDYTGRIIQYHPGTPRHFGGKPYWKVSGIQGQKPVRLPAFTE